MYSERSGLMGQCLSIGYCVSVLIACVGLLVGLCPASAPAEGIHEETTTDQRLTKFERDILALQQRLRSSREDAGAGPGGVIPTVTLASSADDVEMRLAAIEKAIQQLTGMAEETRHEVNRLSQRLDRMQNDLAYRVEQLESAAESDRSDPVGTSGADGSVEDHNGGGTRGLSPVGAAGQAPEARRTSQPADPEAAYHAAFDRLRERDYDGAEAAFAAFIAHYPEHPLAENAHYWLGETYYARGRFDEAARSFASGYKTAPDGRKAPDNLLKLGLSLQSLGRTEEACLVLARLESDPSGISGAFRARVQNSQREMGCE